MTVESSASGVVGDAAREAAGAGDGVPEIADAHPSSDGQFHSGTRGSSDDRWGVLRHRHYRNILGAQFISNIGTWTEMFVIQMFVAQTTGRLDDQGMLGVCQQAPIFALGLFGGLTADRVNRRTLLVVSQMLAGLVAAGVAVVSMTHFQNPRSAVHWLFLLGAINGVVMSFNFPAWQVLTPRLVPRDELVKAITLNGIQFNMARVLGPAIAGWVFARYGGPPLLWFNTVTFFMMGAVVMTTPNSPVAKGSGEPIWHQIAEALRFLLHERGPRAVLIAQVLLSLLAAPLVRLLSNFVIDVYGLDISAAAAAAGTLLAIQGVGAVVGGLSLRYIPSWYPKHHFIPMAVSGLGISICVFALTTTLWAGYAAMAVCGWFWIWGFNQSWAALQVITPDRLRGRALSLATVASFGGTAVGVFIAGQLGEMAKDHHLLTAAQATQGSVLILSVPLALAGLWMMTHRVPEVDGLPPASESSLGRRNFIDAITARAHRPVEVTEPVEST